MAKSNKGSLIGRRVRIETPGDVLNKEYEVIDRVSYNGNTKYIGRDDQGKALMFGPEFIAIIL